MKNKLVNIKIRDWSHYTTLISDGETFSPKIMSAIFDVIDYYEDFNLISDTSEALKIFSAVKTLEYYNLGVTKSPNFKDANMHFFRVNGYEFTYYTGSEIDCTLKNRWFNICKLFLTMAHTIMYESNIARDYNESDFLTEFGYLDGTAKSYKEGIDAYREMQENKEKVLKIWDEKLVNNIQEILAL